MRFRPLLAASAIAVAAATAASAQPVAIRPVQIDGGVVRYSWVDGVPAQIYCQVDRTCDIGMPKGEKLVDVASPGSTKRIGPNGWTIDLGHGDRPYIYVTPAESSPTTDLIVTTNLRRYTFLLIPKYTATISYTIEPPTPPPAAPLASPTPNLDLIPIESPTPTTSDTKFTVDNSMRAPFAPTVSPERIGELTIIQLPAGYYAQPDIAQYYEHGKNWQIVPVGWSWEAETHRFIVQGVFPALVLYVGDGKDQIRVIIRRSV